LKDLSENGQNLLEKLLEKLLGDDSDAIGKIQNIHYIEFLTLIDYLRSKDFQKDGANLLLKKIAETGRLFFDAGDDDEDDEN